jgi:hypothetical protein
MREHHPKGYDTVAQITSKTYVLAAMLGGIGSYQLDNMSYDLFIPGYLFRVQIDVTVNTVYDPLVAKALELVGKVVTIIGEHDGTTLHVTSITEEK